MSTTCSIESDLYNKLSGGWNILENNEAANKEICVYAFCGLGDRTMEWIRSLQVIQIVTCIAATHTYSEKVMKSSAPLPNYFSRICWRSKLMGTAVSYYTSRIMVRIR